MSEETEDVKQVVAADNRQQASGDLGLASWIGISILLILLAVAIYYFDIAIFSFSSGLSHS